MNGTVNFWVAKLALLGSAWLLIAAFIALLTVNDIRLAIAIAAMFCMSGAQLYIIWDWSEIQWPFK